MTDLQVHVTFRKAVSDGNYGTESAEVSLSAEALPVAQSDLAEVMLRQARALVHVELARSPSSTVRRALEDPWKRAEESAEYELAAGLRDNARAAEEVADTEDLPY